MAADEHPKVKLARAIWDATAEGDPQRLRELMADDVVWRDYGRSPMSGEYIGPEQVIDHLGRIGEAADELRSTLHTIFYNDEGAVLLYGVDARRGSRSLQLEQLLMLRFENDRLIAAYAIPTDQYENDRFWS